MRKFLLLLVLILAVTLRLFRLGANPPSLYWDEVSLGYNAYTILTSGHDEHNEFLPITRFIAFGDYKPPGYIYLSAMTEWLFGLTEFAVRFPSMIAGIIMVLFTYLLVNHLWGKWKLALLSSFFLAISPWSLQFSRAAFEANVAACFNLLGIYFFVLCNKKKWAILLSITFFTAAFYTFNANRIISPLTIGGLIILYRKDLRKNLFWFIISIFMMGLLLYPSFSYLTNRESRLRFQEVSIFNNLDPIRLSNERIRVDGNSLWGKLIHNRRIQFSSDYLIEFFRNFSGRFLFTDGDGNPRLSVQGMGELYLWDLPFIIIGIFFLLRNRQSSKTLLFFWMIVAIIPAATARENPHALRIASIFPVYQIIASIGLYQAMIYFQSERTRKYRKKFISAITILLVVNVFSYLHQYYIHYPEQWSSEWQYGYKEMVHYVSSIQDKYDAVYVTEALGRPYIYFAFYQKIPQPTFFALRQATRDWYGFWNVSAIGKIHFGWDNISTLSGKILLVTTPGNLPSNYRVLTSIKNINQTDVFIIAEKT